MVDPKITIMISAMCRSTSVSRKEAQVGGFHLVSGDAVAWLEMFLDDGSKVGGVGATLGFSVLADRADRVGSSSH